MSQRKRWQCNPLGSGIYGGAPARASHRCREIPISRIEVNEFP
jgi:hypothetical protein